MASPSNKALADVLGKALSTAAPGPAPALPLASQIKPLTTSPVRLSPVLNGSVMTTSADFESLLNK